MSGGHLCRKQKHRPSRQARRGITLCFQTKGFPQGSAGKIDFRALPPAVVDENRKVW